MGWLNEPTIVEVDWTSISSVRAAMKNAHGGELPLAVFGKFDGNLARHAETLLALTPLERQVIFNQANWANWGARGIHHAVHVLVLQWVQSKRFPDALTLLDDLLTAQGLAAETRSLALWLVQNRNNELGVQPQRARSYIANVMRDGGGISPAVFYYIACVQAELGDHQGLLLALRCAIRLGYDRTEIQADSVIAPMLDAATFGHMMNDSTDRSTLLLNHKLALLDDRATFAHSPQRVAARALALTAVAWRASLPGQRGLAIAKYYDEAIQEIATMRRWLSERGLDDELEPDEAAFLQSPLSTNMTHECVDRSWSIETAAILGWALGKVKLPQYEQKLEQSLILSQLGLGCDQGDALISGPSLRRFDDITKLHRQLTALRWRTTEWRVHPTTEVDFANISIPSASLGLDLGYVKIQGDLVVSGKLIHQAKSSKVEKLASLTLERYRALAWLTAPASTKMSMIDTAL